MSVPLISSKYWGIIALITHMHTQIPISVSITWNTYSQYEGRGENSEVKDQMSLRNSKIYMRSNYLGKVLKNMNQ